MIEKSKELTIPSLFRSAVESPVNHLLFIIDQSRELTMRSLLRSPLRVGEGVGVGVGVGDGGGGLIEGGGQLEVQLLDWVLLLPPLILIVPWRELTIELS